MEYVATSAYNPGEVWNMFDRLTAEDGLDSSENTVKNTVKPRHSFLVPALPLLA
jgi:DUF1365 family protein